MRREPRPQQRSVALAGIDVDVFIRAFAVAVDDVFAVECVVLVDWVVGTKSVRVDSQWLLLAVVINETSG